MKQLYLLITLILMSHTTLANSNLSEIGLATLITVTVIGVLNFLVLLIFSFYRFTQKEHKVSIPLNFAATILIICSILPVFILGTCKACIDTGFLTTCFAMVFISVVLIILNYKVGIKHLDTQLDRSIKKEEK